MMKDLTTIIVEAMETAATSGLCREGQLEIAVQHAINISPGKSRGELLKLAKRIYADQRDL